MRLVLALALAAALAGCGADEAAPPAAPVETGDSGRVAGTTLDGEQVSLADFRGRPVLVNVWSSW